MPGGFVHLDVRSYFSLKEGAFSPESLARRAAELRMPAVALADRDGLYGTARFVDACEREGVRPILGASLTVREAGTLPLPRTGRQARGRERPAPRAGRGRVREPVPAGHRRAHDGRARRSLAHPRADLRARGWPGRGPGSDVTAGRARDRRPSRRRATRARPVSRSLRRSHVRRRRAPPGTGLSEGDPCAPPPGRTIGREARRDQSGPVPRPAGRVPGRRARVHARARPDQPDQRLASQRRGLAEAGERDASAVRRTPGSGDRHARDRRVVRVRHRPAHGALPRLPDAARAQRLLRPGRTQLARSRTPGDASRPLA